MMLSVMPSLKYSISASGLTLTSGRTASELMTPREARLRAGVERVDVVTAGPVSRAKLSDEMGALPRGPGRIAVSPSLDSVTNGVPSLRQKFNSSAKTSWHVGQRFIVGCGSPRDHESVSKT